MLYTIHLATKNSVFIFCDPLDSESLRELANESISSMKIDRAGKRI
jgi:hypothetical protein